MNGQMVGFIAGHFSRRYETEGELQSIHVLKDFQGRGIGAELLRRLAVWFVAHQRRKICVGIDPASSYKRFYEKRRPATLYQPALAGVGRHCLRPGRTGITQVAVTGQNRPWLNPESQKGGCRPVLYMSGTGLAEGQC